MRLYVAAAFGMLSALAIVSCGSKPPEITAVEWRIEARPIDRKSTFESLSVFGVVKDEDSMDNIEELWAVNDDAGLAWKMTNADWIKTVEGGDTWIGCSSLAAPELGPLPRGKYRLIAIDAAGQRAEQSFDVTGSSPDKAAPDASYAGEKLTVRSDWPETLALAFDATGMILSSPAAPKGAASLAEEFGDAVAPRVAAVGAYGYDPSIRMGAFSSRTKTR